jgi:hypothetical protein
MSLAQKRQIEGELERAGWRIAARETPTGDPWWVDELWEIESEWSPRGQRAVVTFLVDPQAPSERKSGEHVGAVAMTRERPHTAADARPEVPLGPRWESRKIKELIPHIEALRTNSSLERAGQQHVEADKAREG